MVFENFDSSKIEKNSKSSVNVDLHEYSNFTKATSGAKTNALSSNFSNASVQSDGSINFGPTDNIYQSSAPTDNKKPADQSDKKTADQPDKKTLNEISDPNSGGADRSGKVLHALDEMWKNGFKKKDATGDEYVSINFGDKLSPRVGGGYHIQYQDGRNYKDYYADGSVGLGFNDGNINASLIMHPDGTIERKGGL